MDTDSTDAAGTPGAAAVHRGRSDCIARLRDELLALAPPPDVATAAGARPRQAWLLDPDFVDWPLGDAAVLDALARWLRLPGRRLTLVAQDFEATARAHPRLQRWRRDWSHRIATLAPAQGGLPAELRGLLAGNRVLQRLDAPDWRLRELTDAVHRQAMHEACADFLQRCTPAWPVTTLGL